MSEALLSVKDLTVRFRTTNGPAVAVDDVSFSINKGETVALVGESGSGKTVTALSILRLIDERDGQYGSMSRIEFEGSDILSLPPEPLRQIRGAKIGMIFQEPQSCLNPVLTVGFQIAETIRAHERVSKPEAWERSVQLLKDVGIADPENRAKEYPHQMSGGMQQRVMIAMALSCNPSLLIADEPTTALDVTIQAQILELLVELQQRYDMAMLFITHNLSVVSEIADRIAVMYAGQIVEDAPVDELFSTPLHPYTRALLQAVPRIEQTAPQTGIPGTAPPIHDRPPTCRFYERCDIRKDECTHVMPQLQRGEAKGKVRCIVAAKAKAGNS